MPADKWTGKSGGFLWNDAANWSAGVPATGQNVVFNDGHSWALSLQGGPDPQIGAMTVLRDHLTLGGGRLDLNTTTPSSGLPTDLVLSDGGRLALTNDTILAATHFVQVGGMTAGTMTGGALHLVQSAGWSDGILVYDGVFALNDSNWGPSGASTDFYVQVGGASGAVVSVTNGSTLSAENSMTSELVIGNGLGSGTVNVTGDASNLTIDRITAGNGYDGNFVVSNGASVDTGVLDAGASGDGKISVTGNAVLAASSAIIIGGQEPVASSLSITNHGSVYAGTTGLILEAGTLRLDPTATLFGGIVSLAGHIEADRGAALVGGTVTLGQAIGYGAFSDDPQFGGITTLDTRGAVVLDVSGKLSGSSGTALQIAGNVVLSNAHNVLPQMNFYAGTLTVAVTGAAGTGVLSFLDAYSPVNGIADLVVAKGAALTAAIGGFGNADRIDLQGFAFRTGVSTSISGGTLVLNNGAAQTGILLSGTYVAGQFTTTDDGQGGTTIHFHH